MGSSPFPLLLLLLTLMASSASSQTCTTQKFTGNKVYPNCLDLPYLNSFLHWTHDVANNTISVAFLAAPPSPGGWVSWGINPTDTGMPGAQVLVAFKNNGAMNVRTFDLKSYTSIVPGKLSFDVWDLMAEEVGGVMRIFATVKVPQGAEVVNHVWQVGPSVTAGRIDRHEFGPGNLNSKGMLSLNGAQSPADGGQGGADSRITKRNIHGIINTVSWGVLFPLGVIIARYMRTFPSADPAWFYLHVGCELSAYVIGVAGWGTGMKLGNESKGIQFSNHRNIGIALFALATLQIFALFIRPKKEHKYRYVWNIYHHSVGYTVIILGIVNIFKGFKILNPARKWKLAYIGVIAALGVVALFLEAITWIVVLKRKSNKFNRPSADNGYSNN